MAQTVSSMDRASPRNTARTVSPADTDACADGAPDAAVADFGSTAEKDMGFTG
jgi:hypothetical protein